MAPRRPPGACRWTCQNQTASSPGRRQPPPQRRMPFPGPIWPRQAIQGLSGYLPPTPALRRAWRASGACPGAFDSSLGVPRPNRRRLLFLAAFSSESRMEGRAANGRTGGDPATTLLAGSRTEGLGGVCRFQVRNRRRPGLSPFSPASKVALGTPATRSGDPHALAGVAGRPSAESAGVPGFFGPSWGRPFLRVALAAPVAFCSCEMMVRHW